MLCGRKAVMKGVNGVYLRTTHLHMVHGVCVPLNLPDLASICFSEDHKAVTNLSQVRFPLLNTRSQVNIISKYGVTMCLPH